MNAVRDTLRNEHRTRWPLEASSRAARGQVRPDLRDFVRRLSGLLVCRGRANHRLC